MRSYIVYFDTGSRCASVVIGAKNLIEAKKAARKLMKREKISPKNYYVYYKREKNKVNFL